MKGARDKIELERSKLRNIIESFENRGKGLTIKGQKIITNDLLCSQLYHCTAAFPLKLRDFSGIQKIIDNFTHKKKTMSGSRKYLPLSRACLALPCLTSRHQAARLAMLKNIILPKIDNQTIPGWAIILEKALQKLGFSSLENLLISSGYADLQLVRKHLAQLGLLSFSALFDNYITISNLLSNDDIGPKCFKKKRRRKNNNSKGASKNRPTNKTTNDSGPSDSSSKKQAHHGTSTICLTPLLPTSTSNHQQKPKGLELNGQTTT